MHFAHSLPYTPLGDDKYNPKYYKGQHKESKEARRARNKAAKRQKFDPEQSESTRQVQERLAPARPALPPPSSGNSSRIEALRAKLHARLAEKASQRPSDPNVVSKRAARRAEKQRRKEEAQKKKRATSHVKDASKKNFTLAKESSKGIADDLETLDFGKLAGLNPSPKHFQNNKSLANLNKGKNLEKLLADAEQKKQRLDELKRGNEEEKKKAKNIMWGDTLKEASGERVKDDPAKLKRELKRKIAKKKKSRKAWQSRMEQTKEKTDDRQRIRKHNLDKRKLGGTAGANLSKKQIVEEDDTADADTKGRRRLSRAGFEGKKQEFLNQKGGKKNQ